MSRRYWLLLGFDLLNLKREGYHCIWGVCLDGCIADMGIYLLYMLFMSTMMLK
jgi:hypothetical protein